MNAKLSIESVMTFFTIDQNVNKVTIFSIRQMGYMSIHKNLNRSGIISEVNKIFSQC